MAISVISVLIMVGLLPIAIPFIMIAVAPIVAFISVFVGGFVYSITRMGSRRHKYSVMVDKNPETKKLASYGSSPLPYNEVDKSKAA